MFRTCEALADRKSFISVGYLEECSEFVYRLVHKNFPLLYLLHKRYMSDACLLFHVLNAFYGLVFTKGCFTLSDLNINLLKLKRNLLYIRHPSLPLNTFHNGYKNQSVNDV